MFTIPTAPIWMTQFEMADRKSVLVSREVRDELDRIVRSLGGRGVSVSGLVKNLTQQYLAAYGNDISQWQFKRQYADDALKFRAIRS